MTRLSDQGANLLLQLEQASQRINELLAPDNQKILMGAIGGIMVPKFIMPAAMQQLAALSPMAWALDAFHTVMLRHGGIADVLPGIAQLLAFSLLSLVAAVWLNRRALAARS